MNKKIFFVTIPMQPSNSLKRIAYRKEDRGELFSEPSRFPGIVMLENCILENENVEIITIRTADDNNRTEPNYVLFQNELDELSSRLNRKKKLTISKEILIDHSENREKQLQLFKKLCERYEENADIYMDITYGTKVTTACMFSTLAYGEKIAKSNIKGIYYGKFSHGTDPIGDLYNVRCLYEVAMLANTAESMSPEDFCILMNELWG